ncbi:Protein angel 2 [Thoreauomyces humboldtii]|nr:Protein angel 2 [Thoreauomyces humboldtii]
MASPTQWNDYSSGDSGGMATPTNTTTPVTYRYDGRTGGMAREAPRSDPAAYHNNTNHHNDNSNRKDRGRGRRRSSYTSHTPSPLTPAGLRGVYNRTGSAFFPDDTPRHSTPASSTRSVDSGRSSHRRFKDSDASDTDSGSPSSSPGLSYRPGSKHSTKTRKNRRSRSPIANDSGEEGGAKRFVPFVPLQRAWVPDAPPIEKVPDALNEHTFSLMTYNCLAPSLAKANGYLYMTQAGQHGRKDIEFDVRGPRLISEIAAANCDIVCLQEVDEIHYLSFWEPRMTELGYKGTYLRCTGTKTDGSSIMIRQSMFNVVDFRHIQFHPNKNNVAIMVLLEIPKWHRYILVATTHLLWAPPQGTIKMLQLMELMRHAKELIDEYEQRIQANIPFVLCGDFNIRPKSFLHTFIRDGVINMRDAIPKIMSGQLLSESLGRWTPSEGPFPTFPLSAPSQPSDTQPDWQRPSDCPPPSAFLGSSWTVPLDLVPYDEETTTTTEDPIDCDIPLPPPTHVVPSSWPQPPQVPIDHVVRHPFNLVSVYAPYKDPETHEPYFTTWHDSVREIVDYIWFGGLRPEAREQAHAEAVVGDAGDGCRRRRRRRLDVACERYLRPPRLGETSKMPNPACPSDHVRLVAEFRVVAVGEE